MKISINWLKDFVDIEENDVQTIINKLTVCTSELEGVEYKGTDIQNLVVGQIVSLENHPNSDHLHLLKVDVGNEIVDIVCGAPNVKLNAKVALVREGGSVVGMKIKASKVGGYMSYGMCCSEEELGLDERSEGIIIFPEDAVVGTNAKQLLALDDIILEIDNKSLTNRPDLWGYYGFAREVSVILNKPLKKMPLVDLKSFDNLPELNIKNTTKNCYKYTAIKFENITKKVSPLVMHTRLKYCGTRPINLLADLTNYVMLETAQPMHAFDADIVKGIVVKELDKETKFKTLDGTDRLLQKNTIAICNDKEEPVAVAGVMGGFDSEITDSTNKLLLESATFAPANIRRSAFNAGIRTESSNRYEKSLDTNLCDLATARFLYLLKQIDDKVEVVSKFTKAVNFEHKPITIDISKDFIDKYIGKQLETQRIVDILTKLQFGVQEKDGQFKIEVPTFRATKDISMPADIVEEIARIYEYSNIDDSPSKMAVEPNKVNILHEEIYEVKNFLANKFDYNEVHTYVWKNNALLKELGIKTAQAVKIKNSLSQEYSELRQDLFISLLEKVLLNKNNFTDMNLMEIGNIFKGLNENNLVDEEMHLCLVKSSEERNEKDLYESLAKEIMSIFESTKNQTVEFIDSTNEDEKVHPVLNSQIKCGDEILGTIAVLHPAMAEKIDKKIKIAFAELDFKKLSALTKKNAKYVPYSKYPATSLDLCFLVDADMQYAKIASAIKQVNYKTLQEFSLLEVYEDKEKLGDKKSVTVRFVLNSMNKTLTNDDVNIFKTRMIKCLSQSGIMFRY